MNETSRTLLGASGQRLMQPMLMLATVLLVSPLTLGAELDLSGAVVVSRPGELPQVEAMAATVLIEELERRTGIKLQQETSWQPGQAAIVVTTRTPTRAWPRPLPTRPLPTRTLPTRALPTRDGSQLPGGVPPERRAEGYHLFADTSDPRSPVVWVIGADPRGALYGVGALLRKTTWGAQHIAVSASLEIATAPASEIRGHQLGYRARANSWDAWTPKQFDQYIRELAFFGINAIENIPFEDSRANTLMQRDRRTMNRALSDICKRYGLDYWVWTPAVFDLNNTQLRTQLLDQHEAFYEDCSELSGVFFPGGDPGNNPARLVVPFLKDVASRLQPIHPDARVWVSFQHFDRADIAFVIDYLKTEEPKWFGGVVAGPGAPPIPLVRKILPKHIKYRFYPDITHNKLSQYEVPWWDQAYALTLGREAINPRPAQYAAIHNWFAAYGNGFVSYSDGVHDDVNKAIWSSLGWDPATEVRTVLEEYARVFFDAGETETIADGILALERNWRGSIVDNGAVEGTLLWWQGLEARLPHLKDNWRWQMNLVRAYCDAYIRRRVIRERRLEKEANAVLVEAATRGSESAMSGALAVLARVESEPTSPELRRRIEHLCQDLFDSVQLQTSVEKYQASGAERGAFLDSVDYPMNNRWWLEDEFERVRAFESEAAKVSRLAVLATWESPGPGSYYDDVGHVGRSPHVKRSTEVITEPGEEAHATPTHWWWDQGKSRARLSWQVSMGWPEAIVYEALDPDASYVIRMTGLGAFLLRIDGERVGDSQPARVELGAFVDVPVPSAALHDRKLVLTWDRPKDEGHLNWRQKSRLTEIWLLKQ